jgi:hypothetical protein
LLSDWRVVMVVQGDRLELRCSDEFLAEHC